MHTRFLLLPRVEFRAFNSKIGGHKRPGYAGPSHCHNPGSRRGRVRAGGVQSVRNLRNLPRGGQCWRGNDTDYQLGFGRGVLSLLGGGRRRGACRRGAPPPRDPCNRYRVLSSANAGRSSRTASPCPVGVARRPPRPIGARLRSLASGNRAAPRLAAFPVHWQMALAGSGATRNGAVWGRERGKAARGLKRNDAGLG